MLIMSQGTDDDILVIFQGFKKQAICIYGYVRTLRLYHCIAEVCVSLSAFYFHCVLLLNVIYSRLRCECARCVFQNKTVSLQYTCSYFSFLLMSLKATMALQYTDFHHFCLCVCVFAYISIAFVSYHKSRPSSLFMCAISRM